jgi:DNA-binding LacI/PurR family transcriptional regulator
MGLMSKENTQVQLILNHLNKVSHLNVKKTAFTIQSVARLAQVSASTVSNVLNGRESRMRPETLARVKQAIHDLGFQPNQAALRLKTGHVPMIGLLVPSIANPFFGILARGIEDAAAAHGYGVLLCNTSADPERERSYAQAIMSQGVRGVIVGSALHAQEHLQMLIDRGLAVVHFDRISTQRELHIDMVSLDNHRAGAMAAEHLLALGHRRIVFVSAPLRSVNRQARLDGAREACQRAGVAFDYHIAEVPVTSPGPVSELGYNAACALHQQHCDATGYIAMNDMVGVGLMAGLRQCGYRIPEDVSVIGIDDLFLCRFVSPTMSSVRQPLEVMAGAAVELLLARIKNHEEAPQQLIFPPELVARASTAAPREETVSKLQSPS